MGSRWSQSAQMLGAESGDGGVVLTVRRLHPRSLQQRRCVLCGRLLPIRPASIHQGKKGQTIGTTIIETTKLTKISGVPHLT